ncbi:hypothetical protein BGZ72_002124 [Mortierella alpina]|nr:hypothetical protein BGZ72_002124 [Mortierella alpina]
MKAFSFVLVGLLSFAAGVLAKKRTPTRPTSARAFGDPVQLNLGRIQPFGDRDMCLAAVKIENRTQIQLQYCNKNNDTQIWKFHPSDNSIKLAFLLDDKNRTQCLSVDPDQEHHYLDLAPCNSIKPAQQFFMTPSQGITVKSLPNYCIDIPNFTYTAGTRVTMYECKKLDKRNQQWIPVSP